MAGSRSFSVLVNIGANVGSSVNAAASKVESRFSAMGRKLKIAGAEMSVALNRFQKASSGIAGLVAAGGIGLTFKSILGESSEYEHQIQLLRNAGRTTTEVAQAIAAAHRTMAEVPTSTLTDSLKLISETTLAYGGLAHAVENLSFNQRMGAMLKNVMGEYAPSEGEMFNQLVRALELRGGKMSTADYQRQASKLFQAFEVSGGTVNPENFLGFAQQAAIPLRGYSEDYLTRVVPSLIQEFGGERAGTASTALYNQLMGRVGVGGKAITLEWQRLGLVPKNGLASNLAKNGWAPGSVKENALAVSNPLTWIETVLFPALRAHGVNTNDRDAMLLQAQKLFGRETGKRLASTLMDPAQLARLNADRALYEKALGPDAAYAQALAKDPKMALAAAGASLKNLEVTVGKIFTPTVIKAANSFANAVNWLSGTFERHPGFAKTLGVVGTSLAGLAALSIAGQAVHFIGSGLGLFAPAARLAGAALSPLGGGILRLVGLMPGVRGIAMALGLAAEVGLGPLLAIGWPVVAVIAGIGAAIAFVVAKWNGIQAFFKGIGEGFMRALSPEARQAMANLGAALTGVFKLIGAALGPVVGWLKDAFGWVAKLFAPANAPAWQAAGRTFGAALAIMIDPIARFVNQIAEAVRLTQQFFGLASKPPGAPAPSPVAPSRAPVAPSAPPAAARAPRPPHRARGGSVQAGHVYQINEEGQELFMPGRSGSIVPARVTAALLAAMSAPQPAAAAQPVIVQGATIAIHDAREPGAVARAVRAELERMAREASGYLSD